MFDQNPAKSFSRRKALAVIGAGSALFLHSATRGLAQSSGNAGSTGTILRFETVVELKRSRVNAGDLVETLGYFAAGDGGGAVYRVEKADAKKPADEGGRIAVANNLTAALLESESVNYRMFGAVGDGKNDDGVQIKMAHAYANGKGIPVVNPSGEFWISKTTNIPITSNVYWGQTIIHIDEKFNQKNSPRFSVRNDYPNEKVTFDEETKAAVLKQLKPGVQIVPELAKYAGCLMSVVDTGDRIGLRSGARYAGQGWAREELFYVEEEGRIIGDIAWEFKDFTSVLAIRCSENYLIIEGGTFYFSGDIPGEKYTGYYHHGFSIQRSRTIIRQQWMGLEEGKSDISLEARRGFYSLSRVYDVTIEDVRIIPWEQNRADPAKKVGAGTYGIGGARMLNCTFRNLTAEAGWVAWGVFGTNLNKNFRLENCQLNRVDVHFHCWNLYIRDCTIGFRGISVTGGGDLFIDNTTRHGNRFINFRRDFGAKWDGHVRLRGCTLKPNTNGATSVLYHHMANFDYQYPIGFARSIRVEDMVIDFSGAPESNATCWLLDVAAFSKTKAGNRLFFPQNVEFRNIIVEGREKGVRLANLPNPGSYEVSKEGGYDGVFLEANSTFIFDNVQLEKVVMKSPEDAAGAHLVLGGSEEVEYEDSRALYPKIRFRDCDHLSLHLGNCAAEVSVERSRVNTVWAEKVRGSLAFSDCRIRPEVAAAEKELWSASSELGTRFTNCTVHAPVIGEKAEPGAANRIGILPVNAGLAYFHLNTGFGNEVLAYLRESGISLQPEFVEKLRAHHPLAGVG